MFNPARDADILTLGGVAISSIKTVVERQMHQDYGDQQAVERANDMLAHNADVKAAALHRLGKLSDFEEYQIKLAVNWAIKEVGL